MEQIVVSNQLGMERRRMLLSVLAVGTFNKKVVVLTSISHFEGLIVEHNFNSCSRLYSFYFYIIFLFIV